MQPRLAEVQWLLYRLITSPNGVEEGLAAEYELPKDGIGRLITGDHRLNASERIGIYADMFFYRLLDSIREDFPATVEFLGNGHFHNLITAYLVAHPPSQPSITDASRNLVEFVEHSEWFDQFPFLSDLIRVERALLDAFLAADAVPISFAELRVIQPAKWPSLRFGGHPASQLVDCEWRIDQVLTAVQQRLPVRPPDQEPSSIIVWRKDNEVLYRVLDDPEQTALSLIRGGAEFETACEAMADQIGEAGVSAAMIEMLARWVASGLLVAR